MKVFPVLLPGITFAVIVEQVSVAYGGGVINAEVHLKAARPLPELEYGHLGRHQLYVGADGVTAVLPQQSSHNLQVLPLAHCRAALPQGCQK